MQSEAPKTARGRHSKWLDQCQEASSDLARLRISQPMLDAV
ncbi:MAG: hypothetical protein QOG36_2351, partial [Actinomycetota bacterium]|nr:hypothetical protein [Actinomycetota bacterium]